MVAAIGGLPFTVTSAIKDHLERLKSIDITPVFVFNGLSLPSNEQPFSKIDDGVMLRSKAWEQYDQGNAQESLDAFRKAGIVSALSSVMETNDIAEGAHHSDLERMLMDICYEMDVEFQVAPYLAVAQVNICLLSIADY